MSQLQQSTRQEVFDQRGHECLFCGVTGEQHEQEYGRDLDVHHVIPKRKGGSNDPSNLIPVCIGCHKTLEATQGKALGRIAEDEMDSRNMAEIERKNERLEERVQELEGAVEQKENEILGLLNGVDKLLGMNVSGDIYVVHKSNIITSELKYAGDDIETAKDKFEESGAKTTMETARVNVEGWGESLISSQIEQLAKESETLADSVDEWIDSQRAADE